MALVSKGCPRCHGDVFVEDDLFSRDIVCLQCGARTALPPRQRRRHARSSRLDRAA